MHESDGIICKWPPDYVGSPALSKGNNRYGTQQKPNIKTDCEAHLTINNQVKIPREIVIGSSINGLARGLFCHYLLIIILFLIPIF